MESRFLHLADLAAIASLTPVGYAVPLFSFSLHGPFIKPHFFCPTAVSGNFLFCACSQCLRVRISPAPMCVAQKPCVTSLVHGLVTLRQNKRTAPDSGPCSSDCGLFEKNNPNSTAMLFNVSISPLDPISNCRNQLRGLDLTYHQCTDVARSSGEEDNVLSMLHQTVMIGALIVTQSRA